MVLYLQNNDTRKAILNIAFFIIIKLTKFVKTITIISLMKALLKNAREQKGLKTREVAQLLGIDQALISKFESGTRKPTKDQVTKLSQLLEIDYETLMIAWLKKKILYEIGDEEFALKALFLAEQEIQNNKKINNSPLSYHLFNLFSMKLKS